MKCINCNREIDRSQFPDDLAYCPYCGQEMGAASIGIKFQFCPYCGKKLSEQSSFCPHCGKKLMNAEAKSSLSDIHSLRDVQQAGKDFIDNTAKPLAKKVRNMFGRERKIKKLYEQWAEFSDLPPEEVPTIDELKQKSAAERAEPARPVEEADDDEE